MKRKVTKEELSELFAEDIIMILLEIRPMTTKEVQMYLKKISGAVVGVLKKFN